MKSCLAVFTDVSNYLPSKAASRLREYLSLMSTRIYCWEYCQYLTKLTLDPYTVQVSPVLILQLAQFLEQFIPLKDLIITWYFIDRVSSSNIYVIQQDMQCFMVEFIHNIWWLDMFRTSMVHPHDAVVGRTSSSSYNRVTSGRIE